MKPLDLPRFSTLFSTVTSAALVFLMLFFMIQTAYPVLAKEGLGFITGTDWNYSTHNYGIWNFIMGTLWLTVATIALVVPTGILTAIFLAEIAPKWLDDIMRTFIELLVGIPSVVFGLFGFYVLAPLLQQRVKPFIVSIMGGITIFQDTDPSTGFGIFLASLVLAVMVLPTVVAISREAIKAVPFEFREASYALGATRAETIHRIVLPAASRGIVTSMVLATMRAMGETMAIAMLLGGGGNHSPVSIFDSAMAMTTKILADIGYYSAMDEPKAALFGIAVVLFLIEMGFVAALRLLSARWKGRY